jgi:hypothetical protein
MRVAAQAFHFFASASVGDGCAGPWKPAFIPRLDGETVGSLARFRRPFRRRSDRCAVKRLV